MKFSDLQNNIGVDKIAHFGIWAFCALAANELIPKITDKNIYIYLVWTILALLTFLKEYVDVKDSKVWSWYDIAAGLSGLIMAVIICVV